MRRFRSPIRKGYAPYNPMLNSVPAFAMMMAVMFGNSSVAGDSAYNPIYQQLHYVGPKSPFVSEKTIEIHRSLERHRVGR